jgi:RNA polymerase II subunit A C-terminal domain phosphatase SSU72
MSVSKTVDRVFSYGTGNAVRLPGPSPERFAGRRRWTRGSIALHRPNVYDFGVPYETMQNDLTAKDAALYERNGVLAMLQRNKAVKPAPERWQTTQQTFDIVVTFETRVFDAVVARKCSPRNARAFERSRRGQISRSVTRRR